MSTCARLTSEQGGGGRRRQSVDEVDWTQDSEDPRWTPRTRSSQRYMRRRSNKLRRKPAHADTLCPPRTEEGAVRGKPRCSFRTDLAELTTEIARFTGVGGQGKTGADELLTPQSGQEQQPQALPWLVLLIVLLIVEPDTTHYLNTMTTSVSNLQVKIVAKKSLITSILM